MRSADRPRRRLTAGGAPGALRRFVVVAGATMLVMGVAPWPGVRVAAAQEASGGERTADAAARTGARPPASRWLPRVTLDNDAYNFWLHPGHRTDEQYTNGVVLSVEALRAPWWGRRLGGGAPECAHADDRRGACLSTQLSIAHSMFTPNLERPPFSSPSWRNERPYAAFLSLGAEGRRISPRGLRTYTLLAGVTGEPALGKLAQSIAHTINASYTTRAEGWETQVGFEPALLVGMRQALLAARWAPGGRGVLDIAPSAGFSLGNVRTAADAGGRVRLGINLSHPWDPRTWRARPDWEFQVSAAGRREYVAHDFSLDGTMFSTPERRVTRVPTVDEYEFGTALRLHRFTIGYRAITRSREYITGPARHAFSQMYSAIEFYP